MSAGNQSSDGWLDTESDDASKDGSDALRVARGASNASSNGSDYSDDCKAGACATSSNGKIQGTRKRKTDRRQGALDQWDFVHGYVQVTEERINAMLAQTAKSELGGSAQWTPDVWKPKTGFNKLGLRRRKYLCPFRGAANASCQAQLRVTVDTQGQWTLERKTAPHADHAINNRKRGISKLLACTATSPSKKDMVPRAVVARAAASSMGR